MDSIYLQEVGNLDSLTIVHSDNIPIPDEYEVIIQVFYTSLNPVDYKLALGYLNKNPPRVLGHEVYGEVVNVGSGVTRCKIGDCVASYLAQSASGLSSYTKSREELITVVPIDSKVSPMEWSATFLTSVTAKECINRTVFTNNMTCLITGASGGVGHWIIQMLQKIPQVTRIICVVTSEESKQKMLNIYKIPIEDILFIKRGSHLGDLLLDDLKIDVAYDLVGGLMKQICFQLLTFNGQLITICEEKDLNFIYGNSVYSATNSQYFAKSLSIVFVLCGARALFGTPKDLIFYANLMDEIRNDILLDKYFPPNCILFPNTPTAVTNALQLLYNGNANGKLVINWK